jgi:TetR/AcrR family transcriptional regulator, cholesterol catabolism regulator
MTANNSTRQRIVAGARHHFFAYGFRGVTMDDLAAQLGMSKKTLYAHFRSKIVLLEAVVMDKFHDVQNDLQEILESRSSDFPGTLHRMVTTIQEHIGEIQPTFLRDIERGVPGISKLVESRRREIINNYFGKLLEEGRRAGIIRKDIPLGLVVDLLIGARQIIMDPEKLERLGLTPRACFSALITIILEGVITGRERTRV